MQTTKFDGNRGGCQFLEYLRLSPQGLWEDLCAYDTPSYLKHRPLFLESSGVASRLALQNEHFPFAVGSVRAIVSAVNDLFLTYTCTVFAMRGLQAAYFIGGEL